MPRGDQSKSTDTRPNDLGVAGSNLGWVGDLEDVFPDEAEIRLVHERAYIIRAYVTKQGHLLLRGVVRDQKPPGLYVADDPSPLTIHQMVVDLELSVPSLEITRAEVVFESHPHDSCPAIAAGYAALVGLAVGRGYNRRVVELFGGPRGCTHVTALLQAMAPVAVQARLAANRARLTAEPDTDGAAERVRDLRLRNVGSCHLWADDGPLAERVRDGMPNSVPLPVRRRLAELGLDDSHWQRA